MASNTKTRSQKRHENGEFYVGQHKDLTRPACEEFVADFLYCVMVRLEGDSSIWMQIGSLAPAYLELQTFHTGSTWLFHSHSHSLHRNCKHVKTPLFLCVSTLWEPRSLARPCRIASIVVFSSFAQLANTVLLFLFNHGEIKTTSNSTL